MKKIFAAKYRRFVLYVEILMALILLLLAYNFVPLNKGTKTFYNTSSNLDNFIDTLKTHGYEVTWIDKMLLKYNRQPTEGWYNIDSRKQGRFSFFKNLHKQKTDKTMEVVIYAGETKVELTKRLANDMKLDHTKLLNVYQSLARFEEADILAKRYTIAREAEENATMQYLFSDSRRELKTFEKMFFKSTPNTLELKIIFIIASIIQKESNSVQEMSLISSVIYNRLKKGMKLQMDGTLNYGKYAHTIVTPERIKNDKSLYNTYKHKGLPPHPLGTVTLNALKASMQPSKSDYLFFMLNSKGTHDFTVSYDKHLEKIKAFRLYQKERKRKKEPALENEDINHTKPKTFGIGFKMKTFKSSSKLGGQ